MHIGAPFGTGAAKLGGNYAPTFGPIMKAKKMGYPLTLHLDAKTRTFIDEFSTSNFVALTPAGKIIYPPVRKKKKRTKNFI